MDTRMNLIGIVIIVVFYLAITIILGVSGNSTQTKRLVNRLYWAALGFWNIFCAIYLNNPRYNIMGGVWLFLCIILLITDILRGGR